MNNYKYNAVNLRIELRNKGLDVTWNELNEQVQLEMYHALGKHGEQEDATLQDRIMFAVEEIGEVVKDCIDAKVARTNEDLYTLIEKLEAGKKEIAQTIWTLIMVNYKMEAELQNAKNIQSSCKQ